MAFREGHFNCDLIHLMSWLCRIVAGLITGFGLDFLARMLSGPNVDRATLQLVGTSFASTLVPGLAGVLLALQQKHLLQSH
eukprot:63885-Amphidinium_carterae.1